MSRYIDADLLKQAIFAKWYTCEEIDETIDQQPTADVREVVRGEWEYTGISEDINDMYMCSNCKMFVYSKKWNYCPNCGADMRKEDV